MTITNNIYGYANIAGTPVRYTSCNISKDQSPLFYNTIIGLRDTVPSGLFDSKSDGGSLNKQRQIYRSGVGIYKCSISYFIAGSEPLFELAKTGNEFDIGHPSGSGLTGCRVNSYTFTVSAGDVATVSADIMALDSGGSSGGEPLEEVLATWDSFYVGGEACDLQSFSFTINNNCKPIYTCSNLFPTEIRIGTQAVSISYATYGGQSLGSSITLTGGGMNVTFGTLLDSGGGLQAASSGPQITTLNFEANEYSLGA